MRGLLEAPSARAVELALHRIWVCEPKAGLRDEDRKKAREIHALLEELRRVLARRSSATEVTVVDAAAGKSFLGILAAELLLRPLGDSARVFTLEREPDRVAASRDAVSRLQGNVQIECLQGNVEDAALWPRSPTATVALHACGGAADAVIERSIAAHSKELLLVPCCTGRSVAAMARAERHAAAVGIPRHASVRRRYLQALVDAERVLRLEAAGYQTEVVEFVSPRVTPHNLLFRARLTRDAVRKRADCAA